MSETKDYKQCTALSASINTKPLQEQPHEVTYPQMSFNKDTIVKFSGLQLIKMSRWNISIKNQRIYSYVSTYFG